MADPSFDPSKKKKKKKKLTFDPEGGDEAAPAEPEAAPEGAAVEENSKENVQPDKVPDEPDVLDFGKKKKKKKTGKTALDDDKEESSGPTAPPAGSDLVDAQSEWPDFTYDELLSRVYGIMREKNPELATGEKKKFVMKPPQVARIGSKKTAFVNFAEICRLLKRQAKHVLAFLLAELGTSGSIDGNNQLIVKGRFQQKHFENVLRKYIKEYVTCHTCKSSETVIQKDTRLQFLQCETCGSRCSVAQIKAGFHAVTTKRKALRAAAAATTGQ